MEGSMIFCQKNILEHTRSFFGGRGFTIKKKSLLTKGVSQILPITRLIPEIKVFYEKQIFHFKFLFS
jgi:hypothetical protein